MKSLTFKQTALALGSTLTVATAVGLAVAGGAPQAGQVTAEDLRVAFDDAMSCMADSGLEIRESDFEIKSDGHVRTSYWVIDPTTPDGPSKTEEDCWEAHYAEPMANFAAAHPVAESEIERIVNEVFTCLTEAGVIDPSSPDPYEAVSQAQTAHPNDHARCREAAEHGN